MNIDKAKINAIILTGDLDLQRFPVASSIPTALWPVSNKKAIENIIASLIGSGITDISFCCNKDIWPSFGNFEFVDYIKVFQEELPLGTAGAFREAARNSDCELFIIMPAGMIRPPSFEKLIKSHLESKSQFTVVFNPPTDSQQMFGTSSSIYLADKGILKYIPQEGFYDIKESLIPELLRLDIKINTAIIEFPVGNFNNSSGYFIAMLDNINNNPENLGLNVIKHDENVRILSDGIVNISSSAKIYGTAILLDGANVADNTCILGPAIIGRNVRIGSNSLVAKSVIWDGAEIGEDVQLQRCLIASKAFVPNGAIAVDRDMPFKGKNVLQTFMRGGAGLMGEISGKIQNLLENRSGIVDKLNGKTSNGGSYGRNNLAWFAMLILLLSFFWSYWPQITDLWNIWQKSDEYSSGLLVPFLAVYILWSRRDRIVSCRIKPSIWGLFGFLCAQSVRLFGLFFMYASAERLSIVLSIASLALFLFGWELFRRVFTIMIFLFLMIPLPNFVRSALAIPLQVWSTNSAVFLLEMMGYKIIQEGNIIHIENSTVAVAEACNGLRMIMAFMVIAALVIMLVKNKWWEKLIILVSIIPIALVCNTIRLTFTSIAFTLISGDYWEKIFHDFGGYAMMPLALCLIILELYLSKKLTMAPG